VEGSEVDSGVTDGTADPARECKLADAKDAAAEGAADALAAGQGCGLKAAVKGWLKGLRKGRGKGGSLRADRPAV
jgi:hypothetical protein